MPKVFIGIDQSFRGCAAVVLDENGAMIAHELAKTSKTDGDIFHRAAFIADSIINFASKFSQNDIVIGLEGLAFGMTGNSTRDLAGLQFVLITRIRAALGIKEELVSPTELKKFAVGSGNGKKVDKNVMIAALPVDIHKTFTDNKFKKTTGLGDLSDAYWIASYLKASV